MDNIAIPIRGDAFSMIYFEVTRGHAQAGVALAFSKLTAAMLIKWEPVNE